MGTKASSDRSANVAPLDLENGESLLTANAERLRLNMADPERFPPESGLLIPGEDLP